jgi:hypothetical protein
MTIRALAFFSLFSLATLSCSSTSKCDSNSCTGCCVDSNTCVDGTTKAQCGGNGDSCQACSGICFMHKCSGSGGGAGGGGGGGGAGGGDGGFDAGVVDAGILLPCAQSCAGCCVGEVCFTGTDTVNCGKGGLTCGGCSASQSCTNNTCNDSTCTGCVSGAVCKTPVNSNSCGSGGSSCFNCSNAGGTCNAGVCTGEQCPNGCLDSLGRCQGGESKGYCGSGGAACTSCAIGYGCSDGGCIVTRAVSFVGDYCGNVDSLYPGMAPQFGTTRYYDNDTAGSCGGSSGGDHMYVLYILNGQLNNVQITVAPLHSDFQPVIYVRNACDPPELTTTTPDGGVIGACNASSGPGSSATLHFDSLATSVWVFVDGLSGTSGDYTITAAYSP